MSDMARIWTFWDKKKKLPVKRALILFRFFPTIRGLNFYNVSFFPAITSFDPHYSFFKRRLISSGFNSYYPGILNCYFPGISAEELTVRLDAKGICVSPGAACSARDSEPSHVLRAMGYSPERAGQSLRFSFGRSTTQDEVLQTASAIADILHLRKER